MIIMSFVILIVMFMMGMNRKHHGVVNYKFTLERVVLTLVFMPHLAVFIKEKLIAFVPEIIAAIIGVVFGLIFVFLLVTFILGKIAKIPEYEYTSADRVLGFFVGVLKGFCVMCLLISLFGVFFADLVLPGIITNNMKENFANNRIENSIEYYRYTIFKIYKKAKSSDVSSLTQKSGDYYSGKAKIDMAKGRSLDNNLKGKTIIDTFVAGYVRWTDRSFVKSDASEPDTEEASETKETKKTKK